MKGMPAWVVVALRLALVALSAILADGSLGNPVQSGASAALRLVLPQSALGASLSAQQPPLALCALCSKQPARLLFAPVKLSA